jgi:AAA+ ATPase superfamily predicted ATPase
MIEDKLIGRNDELKILKQFLASSQSEFLALYGRRRVGKTFLIKKFFSDKACIFFKITGTKNAPLDEQINHFTKEISRVFYNHAPITAGKNWDETFDILTAAIKNRAKQKKIVLFFDEFPWMVTSNSRLLENLDYYWNQHWQECDQVKLIICGSSASWIIKKIINNKAGLHNRMTQKIRLMPFNLQESKKFLASKGIRLNNNQILQLYMAVGGIPYYLSQIPRGLSASQAIDRMAFSADGFLKKEFNNLIPALFDESEIYIEILRIIATVREGVGKRAILEKLDKSQNGGQGLSKLDDLEQSGFIKSFKSHFNKKRGVTYRLVDEYLIFYFNWIDLLQGGIQDETAAQSDFGAMQRSPRWSIWLGYAFEAICYKHIGLIREKLKIDPRAVANSWRYVPKKSTQEQGTQIDLLFDRMDGVITICEIKYMDKPFVIDKEYAKKLLNKRDIFINQTGTKKDVFIAMIAAQGVKENLYFDDLITGVVILDDLFDG